MMIIPYKFAGHNEYRPDDQIDHGFFSPFRSKIENISCEDLVKGKSCRRDGKDTDQVVFGEIPDLQNFFHFHFRSSLQKRAVGWTASEGLPAHAAAMGKKAL